MAAGVSEASGPAAGGGTARSLGSRVLYVTYDGLLEPMGAAQVVPYVTRLGAQGFEIEVLSFEKPADLTQRVRVREVEGRLRAAGVRWTRRRYHKRPTLPATAYDIAVGVGLVWVRARRTRGLIVHGRSYVPAFMGLPVKRYLGARLILDTRGLLVEERIEAGRWRADSLTVELARRAVRALFRESDLVVHQTHQGQDAVREVAPDLDPPYRVIPTCVDLERFRPAEDPVRLRRELGLGPGPVLLHSGTLSGWYLAELIFQVAKAFVEASGGSFLVLTRETELAAELARRFGLQPRIQALAPEEVPQWLAAADAGLALVRPTFAKRTASPVKVGEYLAAGLAVAGTRGVGDLDLHFAGSAVAFTVDPEAAPDEVAHRLLEAVRRPGRAAEARALAERYYNLETAVAAYAAIYRELGAEPAGTERSPCG